METQSIPWREKVQLIVRFLRGSIHYFVVALLCACLGMVFNALTPQVIRLTVDSILGAEQPSLPAFLQPLLPHAAFARVGVVRQAYPRRAV